MENEDSAKSGTILKDFQELEVFTLAKDLEKFSDLYYEISTLCFDYNEISDGTVEPISES